MRGRVLALALCLTILVVLTAIDISTQPSNAVVGFVVVAPLVTALLGDARDVALIGSLARQWAGLG